MVFSSSKRVENESRRTLCATGRVGQEGGFRRSRQREMNRKMGYRYPITRIVNTPWSQWNVEIPY